jgi:HEAT repeat protein
LSDNESEVRSKATQALVKIGGPAFETLLNALGDANPKVRQMAAVALGEIDGRRVVEQLRNALGDVDLNVRISAAGVLGRLGNSHGVETLIAIWQDGDVDLNNVSYG